MVASTHENSGAICFAGRIVLPLHPAQPGPPAVPGSHRADTMTDHATGWLPVKPAGIVAGLPPAHRPPAKYSVDKLARACPCQTKRFHGPAGHRPAPKAGLARRFLIARLPATPAVPPGQPAAHSGSRRSRCRNRRRCRPCAGPGEKWPGTWRRWRSTNLRAARA